MRLILASSSKVRKEIFDMLGIKYEAFASNAAEISSSEDPRQYVQDLAKHKADEVEKQIEGKAIIISADSIAYIDGRKLEKPKNKQDAYEMTKMLSGRTNIALTGVTIRDLYQNKEISFAEETEVHFKTISDDDINWYVENQEHILDRSGYSLRGKSSFFIDKIVGDYYNVLGLPICRIYEKLNELGYTLKDFELK